MKIHLFKSAREPDVFGFTADETGNNLPVELGPWTRSGGGAPIETGPGTDALAGIGSSGSMMEAIEKDGFYVARSGECQTSCRS